MVTTRIRLGTLLSPLSRMRPWKVASETATLDNLSNGRVILSVGLGATDTGFSAFGEETDRRTRAELLDESLAIITGLWAGQPFNYQGVHYQVQEIDIQSPPPPIQQPRIPIWVVGLWPREKSMRRVLAYDGLLPNVFDEQGQHRPVTPADVREMATYVTANRSQTTPFDIVVEGETPGADPQGTAEIIRPWIDAGATWWIEAMWQTPRDAQGRQAVLERINQGPPQI
jgi:hypothetical protein